MPAFEIGSLLSGLKQLSPTLLLAIAITSGAVIFGGDKLARPLGIAELRDQYRPYVGAAFLSSSSLLFAYGLARAGKSVMHASRVRRAMGERRKSLHALTPDEKAYLAPYVFDNENTRYFQMRMGWSAGSWQKLFFTNPAASAGC
jgi:hypothetical protein